MKKSTQLVAMITSTAIAGLLTFANVAHAESGKGGKHGQMTEAEKAAKQEERLNRMAEKLSLSAEQKTQVQIIQQNNKSQIQPIRQEMRSLKKEIKSLDTQSNEYAAKSSRQQELKSLMESYKNNQSQQIASILTSGQLAKWEEMKAKGKGKKGKRNKES